MVQLKEALLERLTAWLGPSAAEGAAVSWILAAAIFVVVVPGALLVRHLLLTRLKGVVERTKNVVDDLLLELVQRTGWVFITILGIFLGALVLELPTGSATLVRRLFSIALFVQGGVWANHVLSFWVDAYLRRRRGEDPSKMAVLALFNFFARVAVWTLVVLLALDNLGVQVATLIAGLGVGGIAVGLALQSVLKDTFASLSIILDKPFEVGDFVIVDDLAGDVEHIGLKTTRIRSLGGEELVFGNNDLLSARLKNYKKVAERRVLQTFLVAYETPTEKLEEVSVIVRQVVEDVEEARLDRVYLKEFRDSALLFEMAYFVERSEFAFLVEKRQEVNLEIHRRLRAAGIRFAYPARRLFGTAPESTREWPAESRASLGSQS